MKKVKIVIAHLLFAMSFVFLTLSIANQLNSSMSFIDSQMTKSVLTVVLVLAYLYSVVMLLSALLDGKYVFSAIRALYLAVVIALLAAIIRDYLSPQMILFSSEHVTRVLFVFEALGIINFGTIIYGKRD